MKLHNQLIILLIITGLFIQTKQAIGQTETGNKNLNFNQITTDSIFDSPQIISIISLSLEDPNIEIAYSQGELIPTSEFAKKGNAIAAINASFFDMKVGGSVTYLEVDDSLIVNASPFNDPDTLLNGVLVINLDKSISFEMKKPDSCYENSHEEKGVIGTGPLLLTKNEKVELPVYKTFSTKRHPRTCMCKTKDSLLLITIDGRSEQAAGMNLYELQDYLIFLGCQDAINLDGGGSTTMWIKGKGIVNNPSDKTGERKVANAILVLEK